MKKSNLRKLIRESINELMTEQQPGETVMTSSGPYTYPSNPGYQGGGNNPLPGQSPSSALGIDGGWTHVGGWGPQYDDSQFGFDGNAWAQNFQNSKVSTKPNPCKFVKSRRTAKLQKMSSIPACLNNPQCTDNKMWKRLQIQTSMMLVMLTNNGCPIN